MLVAGWPPILARRETRLTLAPHLQVVEPRRSISWLECRLVGAERNRCGASRLTIATLVGQVRAGAAATRAAEAAQLAKGVRGVISHLHARDAAPSDPTLSSNVLAALRQHAERDIDGPGERPGWEGEAEGRGDGLPTPASGGTRRLVGLGRGWSVQGDSCQSSR